MVVIELSESGVSGYGCGCGYTGKETVSIMVVNRSNRSVYTVYTVGTVLLSSFSICSGRLLV